MSPAHAVRQPPPEPRRRGMTLVACGAMFGMVVPSVTALAEAAAPDPRVDTTRSAPPTQVARPSATVAVPLTILPADEPTDPGKAPGDAESSSTVGETVRTSTESSEVSDAPTEAPGPVLVPTEALPTLTASVSPALDCSSPLLECSCDHDPAVDCVGNPRVTSTPTPSREPETQPAETTTASPTPTPTPTETAEPPSPTPTDFVDDLIDLVESP